MNRLFYWLGELFSLRNYTLRNYTVFLLVLFCIQYIPVESRAGVSWVKVATMAITAFMMLKYVVVNKALLIALLYATWIMLTAYVLHPATFRASTVISIYVCYNICCVLHLCVELSCVHTRFLYPGVA